VHIPENISVPKVPFTDLLIDRLKSHGQTRYFDTGLPSFGILVGKHRKTFFCMRGVERKFIALGRYPSVSLKIARQAALRLIDAPNEVSTSLTASKAVADFIEGHQGSKRWKYDLNYCLTRHLLKDHDVPLNEITPRHILAITDGLAKTPAQQLHAHRAMSAFFNWAVARQLLPVSPLANLPLPSKPGKRDRVLSYEELAKIWRAASQLGYFGDIIKLCILIGQRRGELSKISKEHCEKSSITIPGNLTKNRKPHSLPLTDLSRQIIENLQPCSINWAIKKTELDKLSACSNYVIHDTRRTWATNAASLGVEPHIIERILNHSTGQISGVSAIYNRFHYMPQMRAALELYEAELRKQGVIC
jgi:integrase